VGEIFIDRRPEKLERFLALSSQRYPLHMKKYRGDRGDFRWSVFIWNQVAKSGKVLNKSFLKLLIR